jgi:hypothetical protein
MVRKHKRKSLYEVIGKSWSKPGHYKPLEQPQPEKPVEVEPTATELTTRARLAERLARWPKRPKIIQFNADRIEISIPYQLAIAILLGIVLLALVVFRLGQITSLSSQKAPDSAAKTPQNTQKAVPRPTTTARRRPADAEETAAVPESAAKTQPVNAKGNNRIVIQTYQARADLEPVRQYFAQFGIETEIKKIGDWYYLVTMNRYENPEKPGTNGYLVKQKIIEWGAKYKAPPGYETFGTKPFHDAYGMKFDE